MGVHSLQMNSILIGSFIIILTGIIDDIHDLRASYKLIGQLAAASVIVFLWWNFCWTVLQFFGFT